MQKQTETLRRLMRDLQLCSIILRLFGAAEKTFHIKVSSNSNLFIPFSNHGKDLLLPSSFSLEVRNTIILADSFINLRIFSNQIQLTKCSLIRDRSPRQPNHITQSKKQYLTKKCHFQVDSSLCKEKALYTID